MKYIEKSPSWKTDSSSASQYHMNKMPPLVYFLEKDWSGVRKIRI
jgi:hypothetical protein